MPHCDENIDSRGDPVQQLLGAVQRRFYAAPSLRDFHRDRRMLLYALTWPAVWLERRGLTCSAMRYQALLADRIAEIALHGDPARYGATSPPTCSNASRIGSSTTATSFTTN
jgi:hypothetical protein